MNAFISKLIVRAMLFVGIGSVATQLGGVILTQHGDLDGNLLQSRSCVTLRGVSAMQSTIKITIKGRDL